MNTSNECVYRHTIKLSPPCRDCRQGTSKEITMNKKNWREKLELEIYTEIQDYETTEDVMKIIEQEIIKAKVEVLKEASYKEVFGEGDRGDAICEIARELKKQLKGNTHSTNGLIHKEKMKQFVERIDTAKEFEL